MSNSKTEILSRKCDVEFMAPKKRSANLERKIASLENILCQAKEHLTLDEAAVFLGCTKSLLYKMTHLHTIPFYKPSGKMVYFEKSELIRWMTQNRSMSEDEIDERANRIIENLSTK